MRRTIFLACLFLIVYGGQISGRQAESLEEKGAADDGRRTCFLVIPSSIFSCPLCSMPYAVFFAELRRRNPDLSLVAVFTFSPSGTKSRRDKNQLSLLRKKIRGFIRGNELTCPVYLDCEGIFRAEAAKKIYLAVPDENISAIQSISFPPDDKELSLLSAPGDKERKDSAVIENGLSGF